MPEKVLPPDDNNRKMEALLTLLGVSERVTKRMACPPSTAQLLQFVLGQFSHQARSGVVAVCERLPLIAPHGEDSPSTEMPTMRCASHPSDPQGFPGQRLRFEDERLAGSLVAARGGYRLSIEYDRPPTGALLELRLGWPSGMVVRRYLAFPESSGDAHIYLQDVPPEDGVIVACPVVAEDLTAEDARDLKESFSSAPQLLPWAEQTLSRQDLDPEIREVLQREVRKPGRFMPAPAMSLRDWLKQVSSGNVKGVSGALQEAWHDYTSNSGIMKSCRAMLKTLSLPALKECLECAEKEAVRKFLQENVTSDPQDVDRLRSALLAMLYTTIVEHPAASNDRDEQSNYRRQAAWHWGRTVGWPKGEDTKNDRPGLYGASRDAAAELHKQPRSHDRDCVTPVLGCIGVEGIVAWLHVERIPKDATGAFFAHPGKMGFVLIKGDTLEAVDVAWRYASSKCPRKESSDIRWYLEMAARELPALEGDSLGAAMTVAALQLLGNDRHDPGVALAATVDQDGNLGRVGGIEAKVAAAFSYTAVGITRVIVHPSDLADARAAARGVNPKFVQAVVAASTIDEALALMRPCRSFPWWAVAAVALLLLPLAGWLAKLSAQDYFGQRPEADSRTGPMRIRGSGPFPVDGHYSPTGVMGDVEDLESSLTGGARRFLYIASGKGEQHEWQYKYIDGKMNPKPAKFIGCGWLRSGSWGERAEGCDFRAFRPRKVLWEARCVGEPVDVEFFVGSEGWVWKEGVKGWEQITPAHPESLPKTTLVHATLTPEWQKFEEAFPSDVFEQDVLSHVVCPFGWVIIPGELNGQRYEFEVRNIRYAK